MTDYCDRPFKLLEVDVDHTVFDDGTSKTEIWTSKRDADDVFQYISSALNDLDDYRAVEKRAVSSTISEEN